LLAPDTLPTVIESSNQERLTQWQNFTALCFWYCGLWFTAIHHTKTRVEVNSTISLTQETHPKHSTKKGCKPMRMTPTTAMRLLMATTTLNSVAVLTENGVHGSAVKGQTVSRRYALAADSSQDSLCTLASGFLAIIGSSRLGKCCAAMGTSYHAVMGKKACLTTSRHSKKKQVSERFLECISQQN